MTLNLGYQGNKVGFKKYLDLLLGIQRWIGVTKGTGIDKDQSKPTSSCHNYCNSNLSQSFEIYELPSRTGIGIFFQEGLNQYYEYIYVL